MNLAALNTLIENIASQHDGIERYFYGELRDQDVADNGTYPALIQLITPSTVIGPLSQERNQFELSISIIQPIIEDPDEDNWTPVYELLHKYCTEVYMQLRQAGVSPYDFTLSNGTLQPILHWENTSSIVGWQMNFTVEDGQQLDCEPFSGSELCFAISEATWAAIKACMSAAQITAATDDLCGGGGPCDPAAWTLVNTEATELNSGSIPSGDSAQITAPNGQFNQNNSAGTLPATTGVPSGGIVNDIYPDTQVTVEDQDGNQLAVEELPSGVAGVIPVTIAAVTVNVQSVLAGTTPYGDPVNISLVRSDDTAIVTSFFNVDSINPYVIKFADLSVRINGATVVGEMYLAASGFRFDIKDPNNGAVNYLSFTTDVAKTTGTLVLDWVNVAIDTLSGEIYNKDFINGQSIEFHVHDTVGGLINATMVGNDIVIPVSNVTNSDSSYDVDVLATAALVLPDQVISVNSVAQATEIPSVGGISINVTDGVDPVPPDSIGIVGRVVTIQVPAGGSHPVADYTFLPATPTVNEVVTFTDASTGAPDKWGWFFGDGKCSQLQNPTTKYLLPGTFGVTLYASLASATSAGQKDDGSIVVDGIFDTYGSAVVAAAPWLFYRSYAGDALRIRRTASGGGTTEIPFTDKVVDQSAIGTFVGAGDGYVERVYLQDGSGLFFEQTTAGAQPQIVDAGSIIEDGFGFPTLQFDGIQDYLPLARGSYWGADRSKLWVCGIIKPEASGVAGNMIISDYDTAGNNRSWRVQWDDVDERIEVLYSLTGLANFQIMEFTGIARNETAFLFVQIDTAEATNDRVKVWKTTSEGTEALTRVVTSGDLSGNIHAGAGNLGLGCQFVAGSPVSHYKGQITFGGLGPNLMPTASREAVQDYIQAYILQ